jgi:hypothetical protein
MTPAAADRVGSCCWPLTKASGYAGVHENMAHRLDLKLGGEVGK